MRPIFDCFSTTFTEAQWSPLGWSLTLENATSEAFYDPESPLATPNRRIAMLVRQLW